MLADSRMAEANDAHRKMTVIDWRPCEKNTLRAFMSLALPSGLIIRHCTYHELNDSRWIGLPAQSYMKEDGNTGYAYLIDFVTRDARQDFQADGLEAVDRHLRCCPPSPADIFPERR
jgi:hypothetical protein